MAALSSNGAIPLKFAIAGVGAMGLEHIRNISLLKERGSTIVAVADSDARAQREARAELDSFGFPDAKVLDDWHGLFDCGADAFIVATPNYQHAALLRELLPLAKMHVLCEKPMCTTMQDCLDVEALLKKHYDQSKWMFMVGMEYRWMPPIARLVKEVDGGGLGPAKMVAIREHRFPFLHKVGHWNRFNKWTGGTLVEKACHFFDLMRRLYRSTGADVVSVYACGGGGVNHRDEDYDGEKPDILDFAHVVCSFSTGASAALDLCMFAEDEQTEWVSVVGTRGKAEAKCPECSFRVTTRSAKSLAPGRTPPATGERNAPVVEHVGVDDKIKAAGFHEGATFFELTAFAEAACAGAAPPVSVRDGMMAVAMGTAAHKSLAEKRVVAISEVLPGYSV
mmetsp:Transcript_24260/g.75780  ORF Transcript_24260/g.75780 Transcript_24260/m.75780 type:complete len:394 (+) Transcript_24260:102-1283(+)